MEKVRRSRVRFALCKRIVAPLSGAYRGADAFDVLIRQVWMDRQRQNARRQVLGHRQGQRRRAVRCRPAADATGGDSRSRSARRPRAMPPGCGRGQPRPAAARRRSPRRWCCRGPGRDGDGVTKALVVHPGDAFASLQFLGKYRQLGQQNSRLHRVQTAIHASAQHFIARLAFAVGP